MRTEYHNINTRKQYNIVYISLNFRSFVCVICNNGIYQVLNTAHAIKTPTHVNKQYHNSFQMYIHM